MQKALDFRNLMLTTHPSTYPSILPLLEYLSTV